MEGSYFYGVTWMIWIAATFFMPRNRQRLYTALFALLMLITAQAVVPIADLLVSLPAMLLAACGCFCMSGLSFWRKLYIVLGSTVLAMVYALFHLIELYDPVWIVWSRTWLLGGCLSYVSLLLFREHRSRLIVIMTGVVQGECFLAYVLRPYGFHRTIGPAAALDILACSLTIIFFLHALFKLFTYIEQVKQKQVRERHG